jgi:hypothetical protein
MRKILLLTALTLSTSAWAGSPVAPSTPAAPAHPAAATPPAIHHVFGVVKSVDAATHAVTVTVGKKDFVYSTANMTLDPAIATGAHVEVTYTRVTDAHGAVTRNASQVSVQK